MEALLLAFVFQFLVLEEPVSEVHVSAAVHTNPL